MAIRPGAALRSDNLKRPDDYIEWRYRRQLAVGTVGADATEMISSRLLNESGCRDLLQLTAARAVAAAKRDEVPAICQPAELETGMTQQCGRLDVSQGSTLDIPGCRPLMLCRGTCLINDV